jgi:hypothetical protein
MKKISNESSIGFGTFSIAVSKNYRSANAPLESPAQGLLKSALFSSP